MRIYVAHSRGFNFQEELYAPLRQSHLNQEHTITLPHEKSEESFNTKEAIRNKYDLLIAEVSYPSTGLGIELGWADSFNIPIIGVYKKNSKVSSSIKSLTKNLIEYSNPEELIQKIEDLLNKA